MQLTEQHSNSLGLKSTSQLTSLMQQVLDLAKQEGATDAAVAVSNDKGFSVDVRMGEVETVSFSEDQGLGLTVFIGQRTGSASSTDTSPAAIATLVKAACDIARVSAEDPCFGLADKALLTNEDVALDLYHPWNITPPQAIALALACESSGRAQDARIVNSDGVNLSTYASQHAYANTHGAACFHLGTRHALSCSLIAQVGEEMRRDYDYTTTRDPQYLVAGETLAKRAAERVLSLLGARQIETQNCPVIFSNRVSTGLFASFIGAISGSNLYKKNSFLLDSQGKQIFPHFLRMYEQPHLLGALGSSAFDSEGVPTRPNVFVEKGQVMQYVMGSYSARRLGLQTSANADGVHNLTIDATTGDLAHLMETMDRGLLVTELMGQGVNGLTGDYSRGASGYWVEDGVIQFPVHEVTIAGNLKDMYQGIVAIGNDINPNIATRCGSVLVNSMRVGGK